MSYRPIEDHGVIGDMHSVALVSIAGSIDFLCFPEFDSPSIFAALLDADRGGFFSIAPEIAVTKHKQSYLPDTNVLMTRFLSPDGVGELSDFMPVENDGGPVTHELVRRVKTIRGCLRYRMVCQPRFDYGRAEHTIEPQEDGSVIFRAGGPPAMALRLRAWVPLRVEGDSVVADFTLEAGAHAAFVLEYLPESGQTTTAFADEKQVAEAFKTTVNFWRGWIAQSTYRGRWREMVNRSALVLKLLTSQQHGSIVAAPTFGLPEEIGGERNWDYRYTWIRDASFTIYAFLRLGLHDEARAFFRWIEGLCKACQIRQVEDPVGPLQIMYGLDGRQQLDETTLHHLRGYRDSVPVRVGNAAYDQLQLDIYGELMDSIYLYDKYGEPIHHDLWTSVSMLIEWVCHNWDQPDAGIWEVRGGRQAFLYSRMMCWVAIDRAIRLARRRSLPAPESRWARVRDRIYRDVFDNFWDRDRGAFVQTRGGIALDASTLLMPLVRMISPTDPRWLSTLRAIERELVEDSFVYRYRVRRGAYDGLSGDEGTFSICGFWYAECLSRAGELPQARFIFEKMLNNANHVGLFAEELGPCAEHLGNFPQAFTHLALISAAYDLDRRLGAQIPLR